MASLSKISAREVASARLHLIHDNFVSYALSMSSLHRAASPAQQKLSWAEIVRDECELLFAREWSPVTLSYSLVAKRRDDELVEVECAL